MHKIYSSRFMLIISLFISSLTHAQSDEYVTDWAQKTLTATLSASYLDKPYEIEALRKKYFSVAWGPMNLFFHEKLDIINKNSRYTPNR